ncbi:centrosomal protein of 135 kDa isoform X2 [Zootermopsis nevadensis]|uniref:Centrosomal protein of 135 kDa n=1 Tax=Zootermopsis nevadensis TaxID=136037 RepID=A0A067RBK0_ZOONE|nr:centrosomal protein of 135 kDa isoform X2 [Zootermopsis nevadensis]KDR21241.1 Centrosomal protein of 135 kDa [Zootermopsis nevadensis]
MDNGMLERRYRVLRNHLDDLGYWQPLLVESLPLVERLVSDLLHTTESLRRYKELAQRSLEECGNLELVSEPYKLDNARLVKECNDLHMKLLHQTEDSDKKQKDLKLRVRKLESDNSDLQFLSSQHIARIKALEQESAQKTRKIQQLQGKSAPTNISGPGGKKKVFATKPQTTFELDPQLKLGKSCQEEQRNVSSQAKSPYTSDMMELAEQRISNLTQRIDILEEEKMQQSEIIASFKNQLNNRDREIQRLMGMLEGGRPVDAIRKDYCHCTCKDITLQLNAMSDEIKTLELKKEELEQQVKESVASQHEAMSRAVMLADRNKQLEKELHDIDQMALAVEAECNSTVKENSMRVSKIQVKLENSLMQIRDLEQEVLELKRNNQELQASMEGTRNEKHHLQRKLESALDEKKKNSDRINELTIIEHGLNKEIEQMIQETTLQKRRIAELESQLTSRVTHLGKMSDKSQKKVQPEKRQKSKSPISAPKDRRGDSIPRHASLERDVNYEALIEKLQSERDFYHNEWLSLKEQKRIAVTSNNSNELRRKLNEKEQQVMELQQANRDLLKEKEILRSCIDSLPNKETHSTMTSPCADPASGMSLKALTRRLEQERDLARDHVERLEQELDALHERLKIATETQVTEHARLEKTVNESEERVRRLEAERRELLASQGSQNATVSNFEIQVKSLQSQLFTAKTELTEQRALYNQIKTLQEQTDRALADSQGKLIKSEMELANSQECVRQLEEDRARSDQEVARLKNEISVIRGTLAQVDQEKDGLLINIDNKTEKAVMLEQELKAKEGKLSRMEELLAETRNKLSIALDDIASRDAKVRSTERDAEGLRRELEMVEQSRASALAENRRLHSDLSSLTEDCRRANNDLEVSRQEVENLKRQLQEYVSEVRRVEDMLATKEGERNEMLDHFRSLSMEASTLENNNHGLETEMQDARTRLRVANDRIADLERLLESKDTLVNGYEHQIAELSGNIAHLETQLRDELCRRSRAEEDLGVVRDLCTKLDKQKDKLMHEVTENGNIKMRLESELARLLDEQQALQEQLTKDRKSIESLENLLSSCRKETFDQKLANQGTQAEVNSLCQKIADMQKKLDKSSSELQWRQKQATELSQQVSELQRRVTSERFERVRMEEERRRAVTLSDSQGSSPSHVVIPGLNIENTDDEDRASSSTDL